MSKLTKTNKPGVYRRHEEGCPNVDGKGRCDCNYAVPIRHRGRQHMETYRTFDEACEAKGRSDTGDTRPKSKIKFGPYFKGWIKSYAGRTKRGFQESTRKEYKRPIETYALPAWEDLLVAEIAPMDVRDLFAEMWAEGVSSAGIEKLRAPLSTLFATSIEDGIRTTNPVSGVRIPTGPTDEESEGDEKPKGLTRLEIKLLLDELDRRAKEEEREGLPATPSRRTGSSSSSSCSTRACGSARRSGFAGTTST